MSLGNWLKQLYTRTVMKLSRIHLLLWVTALLVISCVKDQDPIAPEDITGVYSCEEISSHGGIKEYIVEIDRVKDADELYIISNFHNQGENEFLFAEYSKDTLWISNQAILQLSVNGKGPVDSDFRSIFLTYTTDDGISLLVALTQDKREGS